MVLLVYLFINYWLYEKIYFVLMHILLNTLSKYCLYIRMSNELFNIRHYLYIYKSYVIFVYTNMININIDFYQKINIFI